MTTPVPPPEFPGRRLRETRELQSLSISDVAKVLKFSPRQIEALEADELAALSGGTTFVRGFIRSYAKLLKLDASPLLAMLETHVPMAPPDVLPPQNMGAAMPASALRRVSLIVAASIILLVATAIIGFWHFLSGSMPEGHLSSNTPDSSVTVMQPDARLDQSADSNGVISPGARQLVFEMKEKAWIEVRDAGQQILFTGEYPAGSRQVLAGKPPLYLVIGNASNVGLLFGDRPVDLMPHIRADVARLTLE